ncbi:TetR/AcrR family transcriptional regulator [Kitasatospora sp. GAS204B]|uniref:TetR/AcrR family transcriptional regulator n=1 Tax=unclassified Kitasatospora TaxID=2633591 RepID=UPI0024761294|nr:TetR family transcriptional regulator [Kitasatospora sp. GAS204B]MDH6121622.1 AcrR family transcriptional regulator [Kitasatospora sp. GAS204B]
MQVTRDEQDGQRSPSATARRGQIIAAAVQVLAESGYGRATFERIRQRAGISSTRLISYHFGTRDELMEAVLIDIALEAQAAIARRTDGAPTATERLTARIEAELAWIARNPAAVRAMYEICMNARDEDGALRYGTQASAEANVAELAPILRAGQQSGEFREFDTTLMALTLKSAIDAAIVRMTQPPRLSVDDCVREITTLALLATRSTP